MIWKFLKKLLYQKGSRKKLCDLSLRYDSEWFLHCLLQHSGESRISHAGEGTPTNHKVVPTHYYFNIFPKTAWNWKKIGPGVPSAPPRSANTTVKLVMRRTRSNAHKYQGMMKNIFLFLGSSGIGMSRVFDFEQKLPSVGDLSFRVYDVCT